MQLIKGKYSLFYGCVTYPKCTGAHRAHPDGKPLGMPASKKTKELRIKIHRLCEEIWGIWKSKECNKKGMYRWLKKYAPKNHIAEMNKEELLETKKLLIQHIQNKEYKENTTKNKKEA